MPCGGGDIGLNVWVEEGDILFYLSRSGSFDHNNQMLKLGRVRLKIPGNVFRDGSFSQELRLSSGNVLIRGKDTEILLWVDVFRPVVHVEINSKKAVKVEATYESWRVNDHLVQGTEFRANSYKVQPAFPVHTTKDSIAVSSRGVLFFHAPAPGVENIFDYTVRLEKMDSVKAQLFNPLQGNIFGGRMTGTGMIPGMGTTGNYANTPYTGYTLISAKPVKKQSLQIALHVAQAPDAESWKRGLEAIEAEARQQKKAAYLQTLSWWKQFWDRSYIFIEGKDSFISRNYQLFRYQLACNAYGKWPTKFNGGLFTFDPSFVDARYNHSPDFRLWGGGTMTAQNQRLVYYPMLKSGDFDMMIPQFDFYLNALRNAELRTELYWKHKGASFTEQIENFGLPNITEYGLNRPPGYDPGMEYNAWLEYLWDTVFEFCQMILDTERYSDADITRYLPLIESCLTFYDEHYQYLAGKTGARTFTEQGKFVFYPSSAAESYKGAYNSTTVISALKVILGRVLSLPSKYDSAIQSKRWQVMLSRLPEIPIKEYGGEKVLAPAEHWARIQNSEAPQLYPVFPWGLFGIGKPGLDIARNTYALDTQVLKYRSHVGWRQYNIWAARLGLTQEAQSLARAKFANAPHRFPTFWGPGFDWTPDHNWGGAAMIGLQEMLMQVDDRKIYLLPAWPKEWNASFKLHAPYNTTLVGRVINGKLEDLLVTPQTRRKDVEVMNQ